MSDGHLPDRHQLVTPGGRPDWRAWLDTTPENGDDCEVLDSYPVGCWRCNAVRATTDIGLCEPCQEFMLSEKPVPVPIVLDGVRIIDLGYAVTVLAEALRAVTPAVARMVLAISEIGEVLGSFVFESVRKTNRHRAHYARKAGRPRTGKRVRRGR